MKRVASWLLLAALAAPSSSWAQTVPNGHPSPTAQRASEEDSVVASPSVPPGSIRVRLLNEDDSPVANTDVRLGVQFQKIAEGEKKTQKVAKTDAQGEVVFSGLTTGGDFSYRISASNGPAEYASDPIQLKPDSGVSAVLHVYPFTHRIEEVAVGAIVFVYVETRDDVFQFEVLARYGNRALKSWVPEQATMRLPEGFKAFKAGEGMSDVRFEEDPGRGARLRGTFSPGQHQASFRFQLPRHGDSSATFHFGLPPHVGEARFIAEAAPSMEVDVDGFEKPQVDVSQTGQRVIVTRRVAVRGEANGVTSFTAQLSGIPTPGMGRWVAAAIAALLAGLGVAAFRGRLGAETQADLQERDAERARRVLLDEVVDLTRARRADLVGPGTYESARRALVEALARIAAQNPSPPARRGRRTKGSARAKKGAAT